RTAAAADPCVAVARLAENVQPPRSVGRIADPGLMRLLQMVARGLQRHGFARACTHADLEVGQRVHELLEASVRYGDLVFFFNDPATTEKEIDRPAARHVP